MCINKLSNKVSNKKFFKNMSDIKLPWTFYIPLQIHATDANIY